MTRNEARLLHASNLLVGGTGLVYAWMRYLCEPADEFSIVAHPAQPHVQHAHVVFAPLLVFAVGLIWAPHVWKRIQSGFAARRSSGKALAWLLLPMTLSGYLLQVSIEPAWRNAWIVLHVATSLLWCALYLLHLTRPKKAAKAAANAG